jgi:hypothetical protein
MEEKMSISNLVENIDNQIIQIRTKSLDVSFNELFDMYKDGELAISPDYQRLFRWDEEKQSRFIESLVLEMPVPPIFVIESENGVYELIDGLQRISSYLHFRGEELGEKERDALELKGCDIVKELNGLTYDSLPKTLQIKIKRSFVRMEVIKKESESSLKYHMFKRLNTGGELLSDQEIRNCTIRLLNSEALNFIEDCSKNDDYKAVISKIDEDKMNKKVDQEFVLRFFALKNSIDNFQFPVTEYLTAFLEGITTQEKVFDYMKEKEIFDITFKIINANLGDSAFSSITRQKNIKNDFVTYLFDGISIAIANLHEKLDAEQKYDNFEEVIYNIKTGVELQSYKTGTLNNLKKRIELFQKGVETIIDER